MPSDSSSLAELCPYNYGAGQFLLDKLSVHLPHILPQQVVHIDLDVANQKLPLMFLTATVLSEIWARSTEKKPCSIISIRATLEASINILNI